MILVDDRAGSKELVLHPPLNDPTLATLTRLDSADVAFEGNGPTSRLWIGVEVKSLLDFISSTDTGRLQATQIPAMLSEYDISYLLTYRPYRPHPRTGMLEIESWDKKKKRKKWAGYSLGTRAVPYGYVESMMLTVAALGVRTKHVATVEEVAAWIGTLHRWWSKPWKKHKGMRTFDGSGDVSLMPNMDERTHLRARVAKEFPGVGFERAVAAGKYFGSVREMVNADEGDWVKVDGIGKVVAGAVVRALR